MCQQCVNTSYQRWILVVKFQRTAASLTTETGKLRDEGHEYLIARMMVSRQKRLDCIKEHYLQNCTQYFDYYLTAP